MPSELKISKENLCDYLKSLNQFKNLNFENPCYCEILKSLLSDNYYKADEVIKIVWNYLKSFENGQKISYHSFLYWKIRGHSFDFYKKMIKSKKHEKVFFDIEEIRKFIFDNNPWFFNLKNTSFIEDFLSKIIFSEIHSYYTIPMIYSKYIRKYCIGKNDYIGFKKVKENFYTSRGYSAQEAKEIISNLQKKNSKRCLDYYINKGFSYNQSLELLSEYQSNNASYYRGNYKYWVKLGFSEDEAKKRSSDFSREHSVWWKEYWRKKGFSEEDSKEKVLEYNPASLSFSKYKNNPNLFFNYCFNHSIKAKDNWKKGIYKKDYLFKIKEGLVYKISSGEKRCFDLLKSIDASIIHKPYIIVFPQWFKSENKNLYFYACDGYLEWNGNIIIFEYDGGIGVYHFKEKDDIRDKEILMLDEYVLGIIRISETFLSNKNIIDINEQLEKIKNGIQEIKNNKKNRIRFE